MTTPLTADQVSTLTPPTAPALIPAPAAAPAAPAARRRQTTQRRRSTAVLPTSSALFAPEGPLVPAGEVDDGAFDPQRSYLLPRFRAFYGELARVKRVALRDPLALVGGAASSGGASAGVEQVAAAASRRIQTVLEQLALEAGGEGGEFGSALFADAQYAMAALADEIFLNTEWPGRSAWLDVMLERALFGSQIAGEEVFNRIDRLVASRTGAAADMATVYFMLLALGFEGRYRGRSGAELFEYRQRLYQFLYRKDVSEEAGTLLVPQAYAHTMGGADPAKLPYVQRWVMILSVAVSAFLVASHFEWRALTQDVRSILADISTVTAGAPRTP